MPKAVGQRSTPVPPSTCPQTITSHLLGNHALGCQSSQGAPGLPASDCQVLASWMPLSIIVFLKRTLNNPLHGGKIKAEYDFTWGANVLMPHWCKVTCIAYQRVFTEVLGNIEENVPL